MAWWSAAPRNRVPDTVFTQDAAPTLKIRQFSLSTQSMKAAPADSVASPSPLPVVGIGTATGPFSSSLMTLVPQIWGPDPDSRPIHIAFLPGLPQLLSICLEKLWNSPPLATRICGNWSPVAISLHKQEWCSTPLKNYNSHEALQKSKSSSEFSYWIWLCFPLLQPATRSHAKVSAAAGERGLHVEPAHADA